MRTLLRLRLSVYFPDGTARDSRAIDQLYHTLANSYRRNTVNVFGGTAAR